MKKIILLSTLFFCCLHLSISVQAQTLYGTTSAGGKNNRGTIIKFIPGTDSLIVVKSFDSLAWYPSGSLVQASDKKLYGMTSIGGDFGAGTIFSFDPSSSTYTKLMDFNDTTGSRPCGSLVQTSDGKLYGMTGEGGSNHSGVIFSLDPSSGVYKDLKDFGGDNGANGAYPFGHLMQASDGKLYGMTVYGGGSNNGGVIFSFDPSSSTFKKLMDFDYRGGENPLGSLMQANDGKLYGTTHTGDNWGVIFSFDLSSNSYTKLKNFGETDGTPYGSLVQASDGKLYGGTTHIGRFNNGVIFSFDPSSSTYSILQNLYTKEDCNGDLMQASDGKLYGMTSGDADVAHAIFSFDISSSTYSRLKEFNHANGWNLGLGVAFIEVNESSKSPVVKITTPSDDASYIATANIKLHADASDADGAISKVEFYDGTTLLHTEYKIPYGYSWPNVAVGNYSLTAKATDNSGNVTTSEVIHVSVVPNKLPTINITSPVNGATYTALAVIPLSADAHDPDGSIKTVEFYNGNTLIFTEDAPPFYRKWLHVPVGNYSITAKATDHTGGVTVSAAVNISVLPNKAPIVKITSPANNFHYESNNTIYVSASASDPDGTINKVEFYNEYYDGTKRLLKTEHYDPYAYNWTIIDEDNEAFYTLRAVATDDKGLSATSDPVAIFVLPFGRPYSVDTSANDNAYLNGTLSLTLSPNPAANTLNIFIEGMKTNSRSTISILSVSGEVMKTIQSDNLNKNLKLNVSSLSAGVYFIKVIDGDKILYKQFVKL